MSLRTPNEPTDNFRIPSKPPVSPEEKKDVWRKTDTEGVQVNQDGKLRTNLPTPKLR